MTRHSQAVTSNHPDQLEINAHQSVYGFPLGSRCDIERHRGLNGIDSYSN